MVSGLLSGAIVASLVAALHITAAVSVGDGGLRDRPDGRRLEEAVGLDAAGKVAKTAPAVTPGGGEAKSTSLLAERGFNAFDTNHDGLINRQEYDSGVEKLVNYLEEPWMDRWSPFATFRSAPAAVKQKLSPAGQKAEELDDDLNFWPAFVHSAMMIIATEIGDKTFFIAAVMSMRNDRSAVFLGAIAALVIMTILSTMMGMILPSLLPRQYTATLGGLLFLYFGIKLIYDSRGMTHRVSEELEEVEEELGGHGKKAGEGSSTDVENGKGSDRHLTASKGGGSAGKKFGTAAVRWERILVQSLTLTFLAEWGDRSQIATIALASHKDPYGVTFGGSLGHSLCTGVAVMGGRMLASKISEKTVAFGGGIIFLCFGVHSLFVEG